jgi:hypothetical protein
MNNKTWSIYRRILNNAYVWQPYNKLVIPHKIRYDRYLSILDDIIKDSKIDYSDLHVSKTGMLSERSLECKKAYNFSKKNYVALNDLLNDLELGKMNNQVISKMFGNVPTNDFERDLINYKLKMTRDKFRDINYFSKKVQNAMILLDRT